MVGYEKYSAYFTIFYSITISSQRDTQIEGSAKQTENISKANIQTKEQFATCTIITQIHFPSK